MFRPNAKSLAATMFVVSFSVMPVFVHADEYFGSSGDCCGGVDLPAYDSSFLGGGDSSFIPGYDSSFLGGGDSSFLGGYDSSFLGGGDSSFIPGYDSSFLGGGDSSFLGGGDSSFIPGYDSSFLGSYDSGFGGGYDNSFLGGYDNSFLNGYDNGFVGGYDNAFASGYDSSFIGGYDNSFVSSYDSSFTPSYSSTYTPSYNSTYTPSYSSNYTPSYSSSYTPGYSSSYSTPQTYSFSSPQYSTPSYSAPRTMTTGGYSTGGGYTVSQPRVATISQPRTIATPTYTSGGYSTGVSYGGGTSVVYPATPQYPVVYQQPQQPAPSCQIRMQQGQYYVNNANPPATLSWSSSYATSATITSLGTVAVNGSRTVYPSSGMIYTMTVHGPGGVSTCQTTAYYIPQPPIQVPVAYPTPIAIPTPIAYPTPIAVPTPITYPVPTPIPTPVPVPVPTPGVSCTITADRLAIKNGESAQLRWSSSAGVYRAMLSDGIGSVAPAGSLRVMPESSRTYILTVYGASGASATCSAVLTVSANTPYVSLSQIPYTGFDFGPLGNALYWTLMAAFAIAAAYLVTYNAPSLSFAFPRVRGVRGTVQRAKGNAAMHSSSNLQPQTSHLVPQITAIPTAMGIQKAAIAHQAPAVHAEASVAHAPNAHTAHVAPAPKLPIAQPVRTTSDSMNVLFSKGGEMPRIVITRS